MNNLEFNPIEITEEFLRYLKPREKEILSMRFGLDPDHPKTLAFIGNRFNLSRERIRQIVDQLILKINASKNFKAKIEFLVNLIQKEGGILADSTLMEKILPKDATNGLKNHLRFLLFCSHNLFLIKYNPKFKKSWAHSSMPSQDLDSLVSQIESFLENVGKEQDLDSILETISREKQSKIKVTKIFLKSLLGASKDILKTDNKWGLSSWRHINPRSIRDKVFIVLVKHNKPAHFLKITDLIRDSYNEKNATIKAVHNELISDERFVLVGRGVYALKSWGYNPGTVADVIEEVLKEEGRPLHRDEIADKVLAKRFVKRSTIIINLTERDQFLHVGKGHFIHKGMEKKS